MPRPLRSLFVAVLGLALWATGLQAKEAAKAKKDPKADKGHAATVKSVNHAKKTIIVTIDGKNRVVAVNDATKIVGPRGGVSEDGLKDDRFKPGAKIKIIFNPGGKSAKEIHLGERTKTAKDKKKGKTK
jgi:hypothetical protein